MWAFGTFVFVVNFNNIEINVFLKEQFHQREYFRRLSGNIIDNVWDEVRTVDFQVSDQVLS